jgi:hypothetical protein
MEYIEKIAILDALFGDLIHSNFTQYKSFPFNIHKMQGQNTISSNFFIVWEHFHEEYSKRLFNANSIIEDGVQIDPESYVREVPTTGNN